MASTVSELGRNSELIRGIVGNNTNLIDLFDNVYARDLDHMTSNTATFEGELEKGGAFLTKRPVEIDSGIITGQGMGASIPFALAIAALFAGQEKADQIAEGIVYKAPAGNQE